MAIYQKTDQGKVREIDSIFIKQESILRTVTTIQIKINGIVRTVWEYVKSCFGKGFWIGEQPWSATDGWKSI